MNRNGSSSYVTRVIGITFVFVIIGLAMVWADEIKTRKIQKIKSEGTIIEATIKDISINYGVKINNRHPYTVLAQYEDIFGDNTYEFKSSYLIRKPNKEVGDMVRVYVMRNNYGEYYMDISDFTSL